MILSPSKLSDQFYCLHDSPTGVLDGSVADVRLLTSDGLSIPVHSSILASASTVLKKMLDQPRKRQSSEKVIPILGVCSEAVLAFVKFLYSSSRFSEDEMNKYGFHLLALSHVYSIPQLKQKCTRALATGLKVENVIDILQLARLCDAPDLYLKCMKLVSNHFKAVEATEGWSFMHDHDPWLELEILQFIDDAELREKQRRRVKEGQRLYTELSEAMDCLEHICTDGCTSVGPFDKGVTTTKKPCNKFTTCQGLQNLIRHFATCTKRVKGGCIRCKRMWQLLRLHSSICDQPDHCKVPLCRQFKLKMEQDKRGSDPRWKLLAKKVASARVIASLSLPNRMRINQR